mgnify:CR=1 FL=1
MTRKKVGIGVVGCGMISRIYLDNLSSYADTAIVACADLDPAKASAAADSVPSAVACSVGEILRREDVQIVLNLTVPKAHFEVARAAIEAKKSVYCEKPLTLSYSEGRELLREAKANGVLVGCAPDTFLGASAQLARQLLDSGSIGRAIGAQAFMLCHGHESWHSNPDFYYQRGGGPMYDMGPYYLTALVNLLGSVKSVSGATRKSFEERRATSGQHAGRAIPVEVPTHVAGFLDFESGALGTITTSFDVWKGSVPQIEIFGSEQSLSVPDPNGFGGEVKTGKGGDAWEGHPLIHQYSANSRGVGVLDMALALQQGREPRASGALALHVLEIMEAIHRSAEQGARVQLETRCERPEPLPASGL